MKIRYKISLWVAIAGLVSTLFLSLIILLEKAEVPYDLLDDELTIHAQSITRILEEKEKWKDRKNDLASLSWSYWIRLYDNSKTVVYESALVKYADLPFPHEDTGGYTVETDVALNTLYPGADDDEVAAFRVRIYDIHARGQQYHLHIARPIENIENEVKELVYTLLIGLLLSSLLLIGVSYYVAGKILQPVKIINALIREISEKTLSRRIPQGKSHDEFYELSVSLNNMFDRLQYSFEKQKGFVANASHELKTPLSILRLSIEEAIQHHDIPKTLQIDLVKHSNSLLRLSQLVESLLNLSELELLEKQKVEEFLLNIILENVIGEFKPLIEANKINLLVQNKEEILMEGDKDLIYRCLINLIDNAIKYNEEGGRIEIHLLRKDSYALLQILNTGPGIPLEDQVRIFDQFYRVEKSRAQLHGGSGLGLTMVKKIVELHSGRIETKSREGHWTKFTSYFPLIEK